MLSSFVRIVRFLPCQALSFRAVSLTPEQDAYELFRAWVGDRSDTWEFLPLVGHNHPWGPEGSERGWEFLLPLVGGDEIEVRDADVVDFDGGLFAVTTIRGVSQIMPAVERLHAWLASDPGFESDFPPEYRHGVDPVPEYEVAYTANATNPAQLLLDYCIPVRRAP